MMVKPFASLAEVLAPLRAALAENRPVLLQAPPGSGKTTQVAPALMTADWLGQRRIVMLQPRRIAARAAATFMATKLGEPVGRRIGYAVRQERRVSAATRIEVLTEGLLLRRLQNNPELPDIGLVILDEVHERHLDTDLCLLLLQEVRAALRPDLRLMAMSATLHGLPTEKLLPGASALTVTGSRFPVQITYAPPDASSMTQVAPERIAALLPSILQQHDGDILVFLPGRAEIERARRALQPLCEDRQLSLQRLYGELPLRQQAEVLSGRGEDNRQRVILSTDVAESSVTVPGVTVVIDTGLVRRPRFLAEQGLTLLETTAISQAAAEQRAGRAGRLAPGACYRLWSAAQQRILPQARQAEILQCDLSATVLELACWGSGDPAKLAWLEPPPAPALQAARQLLVRLTALDDDGRITAYGRRLLATGLHPRLAHMVLAAAPIGLRPLAALLAAWLSEARSEKENDVAVALAGLCHRLGQKQGPAKIERRLLRLAERWAGNEPIDVAQMDFSACGRLLALAYPDRIAMRRDRQNLPQGSSQCRFLMQNGRGAVLPAADPLARHKFLAIAALGGGKPDMHIQKAAGLSLEALEATQQAQIREDTILQWDEAKEAVICWQSRRLGALILQRHQVPVRDNTAVLDLLRQQVHSRGAAAFPFGQPAQQLRARVALLRRHFPENDLPEFSDTALWQQFEIWFDPYVAKCSRWQELHAVDWQAALLAQLDWQQQQRLEALAPTSFSSPAGRRVPIEYRCDEAPMIRVRVQEMFGLAATPTIMAGKQPLRLYFLSPADRVVQITEDLAHFWQHGYDHVRRDLRGRYPKHDWPQSPHTARPSLKGKVN